MARPVDRRRSPARVGHLEMPIDVVDHAADRVACAMVAAVACPTDPRTLAEWSGHVGVSRGAVRAWCAAAHVQARACLDFVRVLRAVYLSDGQAWDLHGFLNVVDARSLSRLLARGALTDCLRRPHAPSVEEFLTTQRFVTKRAILRAVSARLPKR